MAKTKQREGAPFDTSAVTEPIRICFVSVFEPSLELDGKTYKYRCTPLIPIKDKVTNKRVDAAIKEAIRKGIEKGAFPKSRVPGLILPKRNGDDEIAEGKKGSEFAGMFFFTAKSDNKPGVVDRRMNPIMDEEEIYSGAVCRCDLNFYPYNKKGNAGVAVGLSNIMKWTDGDRLDGRRSADQAFGDYVDDSDPEEDDNKPF